MTNAPRRQQKADHINYSRETSRDQQMSFYMMMQQEKKTYNLINYRHNSNFFEKN